MYLHHPLHPEILNTMDIIDQYLLKEIHNTIIIQILNSTTIITNLYLSKTMNIIKIDKITTNPLHSTLKTITLHKNNSINNTHIQANTMGSINNLYLKWDIRKYNRCLKLKKYLQISPNNWLNRLLNLIRILT